MLVTLAVVRPRAPFCGERRCGRRGATKGATATAEPEVKLVMVIEGVRIAGRPSRGAVGYSVAATATVVVAPSLPQLTAAIAPSIGT